ncbi:MAG: riboflavin synthase [Flavobacteriales bacterium]|nr:riboflavin synthase [Flavobacteriales bacterium]
MFTGIVEGFGKVRSVNDDGSNRELIIETGIAAEARVDQSISHNGVCLTVVELFVAPGSSVPDAYRVTAVQETLERTNLRELIMGHEVNLERCLRIGDRLDGHMVQGHVDTTVRCVEVKDLNGSWTFSFELPEQRHLLVHKGSVCINGVSLTVATLDERTFDVAIIPYTFQHTTFRSLRAGHLANIEFDVLGKYVERMLGR